MQRILPASLFILLLLSVFLCRGQNLHYKVSFKDPAAHVIHVELAITNLQDDSLRLKLPVWMPGYYQRMKYAEDVSQVSATTTGGEQVTILSPDPNTRILLTQGKTEVLFKYDIETKRKFVATSYLDSAMAYIVPTNTFFYVDGRTDLPVTVEIIPNTSLSGTAVATGLEQTAPGIYKAPDFDILYDSPFVVGKLEEIPSFSVNGVPHHFTGYDIGEFDHELFSKSLQKVVQAAVDLIGHIPFDEYTFIGIGAGRGGIEHLNNTTVSFNGSYLTDEKSMIGVLNFLGHEYYHHYNAKRIRPYELGPFDYGRENRTNLLWISEGLTVYYEYIMMRMAGLSDEDRFFHEFENHINHIENNPGRLRQSLAQSGFYTWEDGPFGKPGETISYYQKGPVVGLFLDFAIRNASGNEHSLDDVMRYLYRHYYLNLERGFTDAEFIMACEKFAGTSLAAVFDYVYTTKELDYETYLGYAGLQLVQEETEDDETRWSIKKKTEMKPLEEAIFNSWVRK